MCDWCRLRHYSEKVPPCFVSCSWQYDLCGHSGAVLLWFTVWLHLPGRLPPDRRQPAHLPGHWTVEQTDTYVYWWVREQMRSGVSESNTNLLKQVQCKAYTPLALINTFISYAVVQCNSLKAPPNASVQCQHPLEMYSYGSVCTVQCEEGFNLIGTNTTKCSPHGDWSHALPVCQGMNSDDKVLKYKWAWDTIRVLHNALSLLSQLYVSNQTGWYVWCECNWSLCVLFFKWRGVIQ